MRHSVLLAVLMAAGTLPGLAVTHTITSSGFTFSPDAITIALGDTVVFSLSSSHDAREVSLSTWNANGTTSNGGFDVPFGGGTLVLTQPGTHYYVCVAHASFGMKGTITVSPAAGVNDGYRAFSAEFALDQNYPNPFNPATEVTYRLPVESRVRIDVTSVDGRVVSTLVDGARPAGTNASRWDGLNCASGIYFCRIRAAGVNDPTRTFSAVRKMLLVR